MTRLARVRVWWSGVLDRRGVLIVFVMVCAVAIGGLVESRRAIDTAKDTIGTNRALIREDNREDGRVTRRIDGLLAEIDALRDEVDASHDDIAVLIAQLEALGASPQRGSRTPAPPPPSTTSTTRPCTVTVLGICPTG